jgi:hypothetical protein
MVQSRMVQGGVLEPNAGAVREGKHMRLHRLKDGLAGGSIQQGKHDTSDGDGKLLVHRDDPARLLAKQGRVADALCVEATFNHRATNFQCWL